MNAMKDLGLRVHERLTFSLDRKHCRFDLTGNSMDPRRFGFIEPPSRDALESAITALQKVNPPPQSHLPPLS